MAGTLTIRLPNGDAVSIGIADAGLNKIGIGPNAIFDGKNFLVSRRGFSVDSPRTDVPGQIRYRPLAVGPITWTSVYDAFVAEVNVGPQVSAIGGDLALAILARWQRLEREYVAEKRTGRPPEKLRPWSDRDELLSAIAVEKWEENDLVAAIRSVRTKDPKRFAETFRGKTADSQIEAARRAYYRAYDED